MNYHKLAFTENIKNLQEEYGSRASYARSEQFRSTEGLTENEIMMIASRDSFYAASVGENGYPYVQHRGGPKGFLKVLDSKTLGFLDFSGNQQFISLGNIKSDNKVALIMVDYPKRARLKIFARAEVVDLKSDPELESRLDLNGYKAKPERVILYHIDAFNWNCPQHITPRYTEEEIQEALKDQVAYVEKLETELKTLRAENARLTSQSPQG